MLLTVTVVCLLLRWQSVSGFQFHRFSILSSTVHTVPERAIIEPLFAQKPIEKVPTAILAEEKTNEVDVFQSISWAAAATGFAALVGLYKGQAAAIEFSSGYLLELCLSVDNLFVFLILFDYFKIDEKNQGKILQYGILGAVILRGLFIGVGAIAISQFHQVLLLFAAILAYSAGSILFSNEEEDSEEVLSISLKYILSHQKSH